MKKFLIKFLGFVLCIAIIAGGGYLSYINSDFDGMWAAFDNAINAGLPLFGGEETPPADEGGENPPAENGGEETPPAQGEGESTPEDGGSTPSDS